MKHVDPSGIISGVCTSTGGSSPGVTVWGCNLRGYLRGVILRAPLHTITTHSMQVNMALSGDPIEVRGEITIGKKEKCRKIAKNRRYAIRVDADV